MSFSCPPHVPLITLSTRPIPKPQSSLGVPPIHVRYVFAICPVDVPDKDRSNSLAASLSHWGCSLVDLEQCL